MQKFLCGLAFLVATDEAKSCFGSIHLLYTFLSFYHDRVLENVRQSETEFWPQFIGYGSFPKLNIKFSCSSPTARYPVPVLRSGPQHWILGV